MPAITGTNLTQGSGGAGTSWTTASITPTANNLVLVSIETASGTPGKITSITGCGLTWVEVGNHQSATSTGEWLTVYRGMGASPTTGVLTLNSSATVTPEWSVDQFANVNQSGTNGSGAIVQIVFNDANGTQTGITATLAALANANNAAFGFVEWGGGTTVTKGGSFTLLAAQQGSQFGYKNSEYAINQTAVNWTWGSGSNWSQAVAIEIAAVPSGKTSGTLSMMGVGM